MIRFSLFCTLFFITFFSLPLSVPAYEGESVEITVKQRDFLINICNKFLEDPRQWRKIAEINRLRNADLILPGQKLLIPVEMMRAVPMDGVITFISGDTQIQERSGEAWKPLHINDRVRQGSSIRTGKESSVEVTFEGGDSVLMRENTSLTITSITRKGLVHMLQKLFLQVGRTLTRLREATGRKSRFEIQTPSAVAVARGTEFRVSLDAQDTTRSEVLEGKIGVEAMGQGVEVRKGEGTITRKNEPPLRPRKLLPPPVLRHLEPLYRTLPVTMEFSRVERASLYRAMLARDRDGKDIVKERVIRPEEEFKITTINDGEYFLICQSIDTDGLEGLPSEPVVIHLRTNPLPPMLESPTVLPRGGNSVKLRWLKVRDAVRYHLQIAEDKEFAKLVDEKSDVAANGYAAKLHRPGSYYFRVSSLAGDGFEGTWSDPRAFATGEGAPLASAERSSSAKREVSLSWHHMGEGISYRLQVASDSEFSKIVLDRIFNKAEAKFGRPEDEGTYYVRVSSIGKEGNEGGFSVPQGFEIRKRLGPPEILSPLERSEMRGVGKVIFSWSEVPEAAGYHLLLARDRAFKKISFEGANLTSTSHTVENLVYGTYFFKISSVDIDGVEGPFSDVVTFIIVPPAPSSILPK